MSTRLGAILYEMLSLKRPHPGDSQNAILHHIATQPAVPLESVQANLPPGLVDVIGRTLASNQAERPATVEALAEGLAPFSRRDVFAAREESAPVRGDLSSTVLAADAAAGPSSHTPSRATSTANDRGAPQPPRTRRPWLAVGAGVLLAGAAVVAVIGHRPAPSRPLVVSGPASVAAAAPSATAPTIGDRPAVPAPHVPDSATAVAEPAAAPNPGGRPGSRLAKLGGRPNDRAPHRPGAGGRADPASNPAAAPAAPEKRSLAGPSFDPANPYR